MSSDATVAPARHLVLVTGAGRSGTSTIAGALHYLGLHVPRPVIKPNESNPMGFFESTWPVKFHRRILERAFVEQTDGRPFALDLVADAVDDGFRAELRTWLADVALVEPQVVVKDPRSIWVPGLWKQTAGELGYDVGYLSMLRHPAEVLGSRSSYYRENRPGLTDLQFTVMNLCGWINGNLVVERQTRADRRVVLGYHDLVEDWRGCLARVRDTFDLTFDDDLQPGHHHRVDDFIDPGLRRHEASWDTWEVPPVLVEIAQEVFDQMTRLAQTGGHDAAAEAALDTVGEQYAVVMRDAEAMAHDAIRSFSKSMTSRAMAAHEARLAEVSTALEQARARNAALEAASVSLPRRTYRRLRARLDARRGS
ncbi:MAG TPA: hypothetical protein VHO29_05525 [Marmoricola sp.]|nr:hypothetical protein [Marmoricola sp.]